MAVVAASRHTGGMSVRITGRDLDRAALVAVARDGVRVELDPAARARMLETRAVVEAALADGAAVYGLSTAVGVLKRVALADEAAAYSARVLRTHRVAQGPAAAPDVVRGTMLRLLNSFASGVPGVRPELAERLARALNDDERPTMRTLGSIGQADLAPMADLAVALFGDVPLAAGEGLALVSSNAFATAVTALAAHDAETLLTTMTAAGALSLEALAANRSLLHAAIGEVRPYPGLRRALHRLRALLEGSFLWTDGAARSLQDPLTFRNLPHLLGAAEDALGYLDAQLAVELNASDSNPIVVAGEPRPISVANFEILPLVSAVDHLRVVLASVLTASTERAVKLLEAPWSGLPSGLAPQAGTSDPGLAYLGIVSQSLAAEARLLAQPVSLEMASTAHAEGIEDRATMAPLAARRLAEQVALGRRIVAIELVVAAQAVDLRGIGPLGRGTTEAHAFVRRLVPGLSPGDTVPDVEPLVAQLDGGAVPARLDGGAVPTRPKAALCPAGELTVPTARERPPEEASIDTSFARGLRLLLMVADRGEVRADELATVLEMPLSTVYRYVRTLAEFGFVERHDGRYRLGPGLRIGSGPVVTSEQLIRASDSVLHQLAADAARRPW